MLSKFLVSQTKLPYFRGKQVVYVFSPYLVTGTWIYQAPNYCHVSAINFNIHIICMHPKPLNNSMSTCILVSIV